MGTKPWVGKSVVIIDDSESVREELRQAFEGAGVRVVGLAENGVIGLDLVKKTKPQLVSLDIIMPEMDGIECYRKLRAREPDVTVIMVTWLGAEAKILDNLKDLIPAHHFQAKPVSVSVLEARLDKIYFPPAAEPPPPPKGIKSTLEESAAFMDLGVKVS
jgi:two-component system chemotaxis response regulator CheY